MAEQFTVGERVRYMSTRTEGTVVAIDQDRDRIKVKFPRHGDVWVLRRNVTKLPSVLPPRNTAGPRSSES